MKTPKEYDQKIRQGIITMQILEDCLFSVNKRAKNCRDQARSYEHSRHDVYGNAEKYRESESKYYGMKETLLSVVKPVCIHREFLGYERFKIYDYEPLWCERMYKFDVLREGGYYDRDMQQYVEFAVVEDKSSPQYNYYLFYDFGGNHTFHTPINRPEEYTELEIVELDAKIETRGEDIDSLLSVPFVNKVIDIIKSKNYSIE